MPQKLPDTNNSQTVRARRRESKRRWRENNREKVREQARRWRENNPEKSREHARRKRANNPEKIREDRLRHNYGISLADLEALTCKQNGLCLICQKDKSLCVDHCHKTGVVRGLLCHNCNKGLGFFNDDFSTLIRAANYIGWRSN